MFVREIIEGATPIFGKTGNKVVRKYRCTSGSRKGRIVAKPGTCTAPKNVKAMTTMKKTRRSKGATVSIKSNRTKRETWGIRSRNIRTIHRRRTPQTQYIHCP